MPHLDDLHLEHRRREPAMRGRHGDPEGRCSDAIAMDRAQVAVADYRPDWWPASTVLLIRRVRLDSCQISANPRSRRRRTLHPDQRALPIAELAEADTIYGYSFILTNLCVSTPDKATQVEHWYRHRTAIETCSATANTVPRCATSCQSEDNRSRVYPVIGVSGVVDQ